MNTANDMVHKRINITLPEKTIGKLKRISEKERRNVSNMIRILIEDYKE